MKYQTHSLLIVVVQLPDGPRHDDGERYTWEEKRRGRSFICLRDSDHKISPWGFHAANMKSFSFFFFFHFPREAPAPAKLCQEQLLLVGSDPHKLARTCHRVTL